MLEIESHQYLKKYVSKNQVEWNHLFSFGKILSKSLRKKDNCLINSEIFKTDKWMPAVLISLFLNRRDTIFIISKENFKSMTLTCLSEIKKLGFDFVKVNNELIFKNYKIIFISYEDFIKKKFNISYLKQQSFIFTDAENLKNNLKSASRLSLCKSLYFMQLTSKNPKDERFDISIDCLLLIKLFSIRFNICFERPSGATNLFCKNHERSIEIVIISTLQANKGHINGPPAVIKSFI